MPTNKFKPFYEFSKEVVARYWSKVIIKDSGDCWIWAGHQNDTGYGFFDVDDTYFRVHRVSFFLAYGDPKQYLVCHSCDNRLCCNPEHLFIGTDKDNMLDRDKKLRVSHGERHPRTKLKTADVRKILALKGTLQNKEIAVLFGITMGCLSGILQRKAWKHV